MSAAWRVVRVFISSTFKDMHSERDWLVKRVFPALRERLEKHRVHLIDIDLRWGITEEQERKGEVLKLCLDTIVQCKPYFVGLLGDRYGWVPSELPDLESKPGWTQQHNGKSVTELEILWGVLQEKNMWDHALFFLRDSSFLNEIPSRELLHSYAEFPDREDLEALHRGEITRQDVRARVVKRRAKLRQLNQKIKAANLPIPIVDGYPCRYEGVRINWNLARFDLNEDDQRALESVAADSIVDNEEYAGLDEHLREIVHQYGVVYLSGLEEFGRQVLDRLWNAIRNELKLEEAPTEAAPDALAEERGYHERFMETRLRVYVGRQSLQQELTKFADGDGEEPCLVTGGSGSGKSSALAKFAATYANDHPDTFVLSHFIGASPGSTSLRQTLLRLCAELKQEFAFTDDVPPDTNSLITTFRQFIAQIPADRRVVLLLDALNQLDEGENAHQLYWLPWQFPAHLKLITSCIDDTDREETVLKSFANRKKRHIPVQPLTNDERFEIVRQVPSLSAKALDALQIGLLLANPATENPLYLLVALEELRGFGSFEHVDRRIALFPMPRSQPIDWGAWIADRRKQASQADDPKERDRLLERLKKIVPTLQHNVPVDDPLTMIFLQVIDRLETEFNNETVQTILSLLASARRGLSDREFLELIEGKEVDIESSQGDLFPVLRQLRPYLQHRGELWDFFHRNLYKAVHSDLLRDEEGRSAAHAQLAAYFQKQDYFMEPLEEQRARAKRLPPTPRPANIRKVDELPWQLLQVAKLSGKDDPTSPHWDAVADLFTDLHFLEAKAEAQPYARPEDTAPDQSTTVGKTA